ncbi:unnamed protein product, partial [Amoebophrya sp. A120]|eukprot:GSA120T00014271001.1
MSELSKYEQLFEAEEAAGRSWTCCAMIGDDDDEDDEKQTQKDFLHNFGANRNQFVFSEEFRERFGIIDHTRRILTDREKREQLGAEPQYEENTRDDLELADIENNLDSSSIGRRKRAGRRRKRERRDQHGRGERRVDASTAGQPAELQVDQVKRSKRVRFAETAAPGGKKALSDIENDQQDQEDLLLCRPVPTTTSAPTRK